LYRYYTIQFPDVSRLAVMSYSCKDYTAFSCVR